MKKVTITNFVSYKGKDVEPGKTIEVEDGLAGDWVLGGYAVWPEEETQQEHKPSKTQTPKETTKE